MRILNVPRLLRLKRRWRGRLTRLLARLLSRGALIVAVAVGGGISASPALAVDQSRGEPGMCRTDVGVTVVVDFGALGGTTLVRCAPSGSRGTGLDALKRAGFQIAGVQRWGESFICRIENRPSAVEKLPIKGNAGYQEKCLDTPPAAGYWSYWHAGNNCAWRYSQWGVKNRDFVQGGFEGWSFSLNTAADQSPAPRVAAVRPGTDGGACNAPDQGKPSTEDPDEQAGSGRSADAGSALGASPSTSQTSSAQGTLPAPKPRNQAPSTRATSTSSSAGPAEQPGFSGGDEAADVRDTLDEQSAASSAAPWAAGAVVMALGVAMGLTARRRRRARDA